MARPSRRRLVLVGAAALVAAGLVPVAHAAPAGAVEVKVLSGRADLVSGGDALVQVVLPNGVRSATVDVNGRDVSRQFGWRKNGTFEGLLTGLHLGRNDVTARTPDGQGAVLTITNHPKGGPVFSGPQIQPWTCGNGSKSPTCDQKPTYSYLYKSTDPTKQGLQPYDPKNPPSDVATTTTVTAPQLATLFMREVVRSHCFDHLAEHWSDIVTVLEGNLEHPLLGLGDDVVEISEKAVTGGLGADGIHHGNLRLLRADYG